MPILTLKEFERKVMVAQAYKTPDAPWRVGGFGDIRTTLSRCPWLNALGPIRQIVLGNFVYSFRSPELREDVQESFWGYIGPRFGVWR